ncbi:menaquinone biosynthesis protein [Desulfobotulus sp. H1]|uniref:Chorismate dehydratase n=1 Tax=Desulfobotulus pelophilus TaxID=2823377 RepID=A0ABT3N9F7_9BACT|nr:menaquinone biosynthesis protein [Desulfobotulus pelophilus]MCW7754088.1 menaquinone biosynthesis protein [Desulfobotulus pelophilus]
MTSPLRIGRIDYLNVWPVYHGFDLWGPPPDTLVHTAPPAELNRMLEQGELDVSAVSAFAYGQNYRHWLLLPGLGIGCDGPVMSVLLVSKRPIHELHGARLGLSRESASAAHLLRYVLSMVGVHCFLDTIRVRSQEDLRGLDGGLVIGDAALCGHWSAVFPWVYDLGSMWKEMTGLPFVFGVWAVRRSVLEERPAAVQKVIAAFLSSMAQGEKSLAAIARRSVKEKGLDPGVAAAYFRCLQYDLPPSHIQGLNRFFLCMTEMGVMEECPALDFVCLRSADSIRQCPDCFYAL